MNKLLKYALLSTGLSLGTITAQTDWPTDGNFVVDTLVSRTSCQPLVIAAGGMYEMNDMLTSTNSGDYGLYGYARYRVGRIFSASAFITQGFLSVPNGGGTTGSQEFRGVLFFKKSVEYAGGSKKLGRVSNGGGTYTEFSAPYKYPQGSYIGLTGSFINRKAFETIKSDSTGKFGKITRISDNFDLKDTVATFSVNSQVISAGFAFSVASKFKGRVRANINGRHVKRTIRKSMSFDGAFEALIGLNVKESNNLFIVNGKNDANYVNNYSFSGTQVKKIGWRMWACGKINSLFSVTMQMGARPGIKDNTVDYDGPKIFSKVFQNMYFNMGLGLAIGAL